MSSRSSLLLAVATTAITASAATVFYQRLKSIHNKSSDNNSPAVPLELSKSPYSKELKVAIQLAYQAGKHMKGYVVAKGTCEERKFDLDSMMETSKSNSVDFCTQIDVENEQMIIQGLQKHFPKHDIIGEETVGTGNIPLVKKDTPTWIIDPIDGTTNFSQGIFMTCVSIGFCVNGRPVMGVVYAPATEEWYLAVKGFGAFRNGARIERIKNPKTSMEKAVICCEFGYSRKQDEIDAMLGAVKRILQHGCRGIRQLGSGVLDLCYVSTGRLDAVYAGVVNEGWKPWDYAAGLVICEESGCIMEEINQQTGNEFNLYGSSILCGVSQELVDDIRKTLLSKA